MKPLVVGLPYLLKLMSYPAELRRTELRGRLKPGGHNYYWFMEKHVPLFINGTSDLERVDDEIKVMTRPSQRKHNRYGVRAFLEMWEFSDMDLIPPPETVFISEFGMLHVKLAPVLAYEKDGQKICVCLWNALEPDLLAKTAGLGIYFVNRELPSFRAQVFDLRRKVKYVEALNWQQAEIRLGRELRLIESIWIELNQEVEKGSGEDDRPTDEPPKPLRPAD